MRLPRQQRRPNQIAERIHQRDSFMRSGKLMSENDVEFHNSLKSTDPDLEYKNDVDMLNLFGEAELIHLSTKNMPTNNLAFILQKP